MKKKKSHLVLVAVGMDPLIAVNGLFKEYNENLSEPVKVLQNLNDIEWRICLFDGSVGAGKSTLLNLLGLLDSPTSGTISFEKREFHDLPVLKRQGYVIHPSALFFKVLIC